MKITQMITEICALHGPDPIEFRIAQITLSKQMILSQNHGFKVTIPFEFNSIQDKMQIDLGFGEVISPKARKILFPTILPEYRPFSILAYTTETLMAEKLNALYVLGVRNTRMKDYYDLFVLLEISEFTQKLLLEAIKSTFTQRKTQIDSRLLLNLLKNPDLSNQFERYCKKISIPNIPFLQ
ncbi:MAG: nucleotidyl transferase AbiEii/AbiGii toxin family protein, partial [Promethearchaeota archaeon]